MSDLAEQMHRLAQEAPRRLPDQDLWTAGVRRQRRRRAAGGVAIAAVMALVIGVGWQLTTPSPRTIAPADVPFAELHIPRSVTVPDPWTPGTAELGPPGRLAALVPTSSRLRRVGLFGTQETAGVAGISAIDGSMRFLDIGEERDRDGEIVARFGWLALSPDGTSVAVTRESDDGARYAIEIYDTVSGESRDVSLPTRATGRVLDGFVFTGDSRYLMATFGTPPGTDGDHELVAWDRATGEHILLDGPGRRWWPPIGTAATGSVWLRGNTTFVRQLPGGRAERFAGPPGLVSSSVGPSGRGVAQVVAPPGDTEAWELHVGFEGLGGEMRRSELSDLRDILGWRDATTVVVDDVDDSVTYVDVVSGEIVDRDQLELKDEGGDGVRPLWAADLWANALVDPPAPAEHRAPTPPGAWLIGGVVFAPLLVLLGWLAWRRRGRA